MEKSTIIQVIILLWTDNSAINVSNTLLWNDNSVIDVILQCYKMITIITLLSEYQPGDISYQTQGP